MLGSKNAANKACKQRAKSLRFALFDCSGVMGIPPDTVAVKHWPIRAAALAAHCSLREWSILQSPSHLRTWPTVMGPEPPAMSGHSSDSEPRERASTSAYSVTSYAPLGMSANIQAERSLCCDGDAPRYSKRRPATAMPCVRMQRMRPMTAGVCRGIR